VVLKCPAVDGNGEDAGAVFAHEGDWCRAYRWLPDWVFGLWVELDHHARKRGS